MFGGCYCIMPLKAGKIEAGAGNMVHEARAAFADFLALSISAATA